MTDDNQAPWEQPGEFYRPADTIAYRPLPPLPPLPGDPYARPPDGWEQQALSHPASYTIPQYAPQMTAPPEPPPPPLAHLTPARVTVTETGGEWTIRAEMHEPRPFETEWVIDLPDPPAIPAGQCVRWQIVWLYQDEAGLRLIGDGGETIKALHMGYGPGNGALILRELRDGEWLQK